MTVSIEKSLLVSRADAQKMVDSVVVKVFQFSAVRHEDCVALLGSKRFSMLLDDPIRCLGPSAGTVYPWNVVDYLSTEDPRKKSIVNKAT